MKTEAEIRRLLEDVLEAIKIRGDEAMQELSQGRFYQAIDTTRNMRWHLAERYVLEWVLTTAEPESEETTHDAD